MTTTTTRMMHTRTATPAVPIAGARRDYSLLVHPSGSGLAISCEERGLFISLTPDGRQSLAQSLIRATDWLATGPRSTAALEPVGSVCGTLPEHGLHRFEIDVVRDDAVAVVLVTCDALGIDGVLQPEAAHRLGELLLQT